ncbi:hypothetical protein ACYZTM_04290 [Pseudomonas sp. MDT2-39-1]|uniref:hypothetical protein n=1 Tax=Pseudomonas sp. BGI-2 TaxID=2528211 RepID=UPI0010332664|nr:hypothetical protein [Pseudomonas sp. BGI-2]TBN49206.1 hypothetical protein EYC95_06615 [Pseudomonas sp. BGI-2]
MAFELTPNSKALDARLCRVCLDGFSMEGAGLIASLMRDDAEDKVFLTILRALGCPMLRLPNGTSYCEFGNNMPGGAAKQMVCLFCGVSIID